MKKRSMETPSPKKRQLPQIPFQGNNRDKGLYIMSQYIFII